jgi:hypothetical protein
VGKSQVFGIVDVQTVTVAVSSSLSGAIPISGFKLAAIEMSTAWTTANITFLAASSSGATFYPLYDDQGNEVTVVSPANSRIVALDTVAVPIAAVPWLKVRSGTAGTPVVQSTAAATTLKLYLKS